MLEHFCKVIHNVCGVAGMGSLESIRRIAPAIGMINAGADLQSVSAGFLDGNPINFPRQVKIQLRHPPFTVRAEGQPNLFVVMNQNVWMVIQCWSAFAKWSTVFVV